MPPLARQGFTLVELLVVTATLALLATLLVPALGAARQTTRSVQCQANLRQIWTVVMLSADLAGGKMPYHVGEGDMTSRDQHVLRQLRPLCRDEWMYRCPEDAGTVGNPTPLWETYGSSYKFEGRAFSSPALPARTEIDPKNGKPKVKKAKPEVVRWLHEHDRGYDAKKLIDGKPLEAQGEATSSFIQLVRDPVDPWKAGELKSTPLRGTHVTRNFHPQHMHVAFVGGNVITFKSKAAWELYRKKPLGGD